MPMDMSHNRPLTTSQTIYSLPACNTAPRDQFRLLPESLVTNWIWGISMILHYPCKGCRRLTRHLLAGSHVLDRVQHSPRLPLCDGDVRKDKKALLPSRSHVRVDWEGKKRAEQLTFHLEQFPTFSPPLVAGVTTAFVQVAFLKCVCTPQDSTSTDRHPPM